MGKNERLKFIALKSNNGNETGMISFFCKMLDVSRQAFYDFLKRQNEPWKYGPLAAEIKKIVSEDECNDTYGKTRMYQALELKKEKGELLCKLPCENTVKKVMIELGMSPKKPRRPKGLTKEDKGAQKSDDLLKRDFTADKPNEKAVTDITELHGSDGKLYVSVEFDCFDLTALGISMDTNMKAPLVVRSLENAAAAHPELKGAIIHSDRGSQYTSKLYRAAIEKYEIRQSMNSAGGRCHDNARCESMWARMKEELFYSRGRKTTDYTVEELKTMIWRYFMSYWNNRRICSSIGGMPPAEKRRRYYESLKTVA